VHNRLIAPSLAAVAVLAISALLLSCDAQRSPATNAQSDSPPDLSGVWMLRDLVDTFAKDAPPLQPWAVERAKANLGAGPEEDPEDKCFPAGMPRIYLHRYPIEILQVPGRVIMFFEYDHFVRHIWTDRRTHPAEAELDDTWMGHSIGSWQGDTLVVDTIGFNDKTWLDNAGHPHSEELHVVERLRRVDHDTLEIDFSFDDPKVYSKPWTGQKVFRARPGWEIAEHVCADNFLWKEPGK
jgi:hypothetical protein